MSTRVQRAVSILNALKDPLTVTNAEALRAASAFAYTYARERTDLTNDEKAGLFVRAVRDFVKQVIRDAEISQGLEIERQRIAPGAEMDLGSDGGLNGS
jgi:hypothetical protein